MKTIISLATWCWRLSVQRRRSTVRALVRAMCSHPRGPPPCGTTNACGLAAAAMRSSMRCVSSTTCSVRGFCCPSGVAHDGHEFALYVGGQWVWVGHAECGIEFVDEAVDLDAQVVFLDTYSAAKARGSCVAGLCGYLVHLLVIMSPRWGYCLFWLHVRQGLHPALCNITPLGLGVTNG